MTLLVTVLTVAVVLLTVLVAGLLRSHAVILRRLHDLGAGVGTHGDGPGRAGEPAAASRPRGVPETAPTGRPAADVVGTSVAGDPVAVRVAGVDRDSVLVFLSSGCATCADFWQALAGGVALPDDARLVIVTRDAAEESPARLAELAPAGVTVVLSSAAWTDYAVPGSPYVAHVDGPSARVRGEGTGGSWEQVARLLAEATGDLGYLGGPSRPRRPGRARADLLREQDTDRALLRAGFVPGDDRLHAAFDADADADAVTATEHRLP